MTKKEQRIRRHKRIRSRVAGTAEAPRLAVFKSNTAVYAQLIDDTKAVTIAAADTRTQKKGTGVEKAKAIGAEIAEKAKAKNITKIVFDRGGFKYTGRVAAVAEGAREAGLTF